MRYSVDLYFDSPVQCHCCGSYCHVSVACGSTPRCTKCSDPHERAACSANLPRCSKCRKDHEATSKVYVKWQEKRAMCRYRCENQVTCRTARSVLHQGNIGTQEKNVAPPTRHHPPQDRLHAMQPESKHEHVLDNKTTKYSEAQFLHFPSIPSRNYANAVGRPKHTLTKNSISETSRSTAEPPLTSTLWLTILRTAESHIRRFLASSATSYAPNLTTILDLILPLLKGL